MTASSNRYLKWGIWAYLFFLIFEGALRRWILPGFSAPLLVIRDPIAILLIYFSWKRGLLRVSGYLMAMVVLGILGLITALVFGHGNIPVAVYGTRMFLVYFPLIFVIGAIFEKKDVVALGKVMLWLSIPMAILIAWQFYSPQSAWVNRGLGGDLGGAGFSGAMGYFRPPATFSFTSGTALFFSLLACYVFYFWLGKEKVNRLLLLTATLALVVSIPFSISRTLLFSIIIILFFSIFAAVRNSKNFAKIIVALFCGILVLTILSQTEFFQTATEAFTARITNASKFEGGLSGTLLDRYLGGFIAAFDISGLPFFGYGTGMGTNVGSQLMVGERTFLVAEEEWARLIGEMGFLLGLGVILVRTGFCLSLTITSYRRLESQEFLPWILLSFALLIIPQGQWGQPTILGFSALVGGLVLASLRTKSDNI